MLEQYVDALGEKPDLISKDAELSHNTAFVQSVYDGDSCRVDIDLGRVSGSGRGKVLD